MVKKIDMSEKKRLFDELSNRSHPMGWNVWQYHSFDYGYPFVNKGMSDPDYKWKEILKMDNVDLKDKSVLDIGCNIGEMCFFAKKAGASNVVGIEYDKLFFDGALFLQNYCRNNVIDFVHGDIMTYNFDDVFDYVFAFSVLYILVKKHSYEEIIKRIASLCRIGFIYEVKYVEKKDRQLVERVLKNNFSEVFFIGDSIPTNIKDRSKMSGRKTSKIRQVFHCFK